MHVEKKVVKTQADHVKTTNLSGIEMQDVCRNQS